MIQQHVIGVLFSDLPSQKFIKPSPLSLYTLLLLFLIHQITTSPKTSQVFYTLQRSQKPIRTANHQTKSNLSLAPQAFEQNPSPSSDKTLERPLLSTWQRE